MVQRRGWNCGLKLLLRQRRLVVVSIFFCGVWLGWYAPLAAGSEADFQCRLKDATATTLNIGFGSCNKQYRSQHWWDLVADASDLFIYHGDTTYTNGTAMRNLVEALDQLNSAHEYHDARKRLSAKMDCRSMAESCPVSQGIWAVWDDHDFGINDAGGEPFPYLQEDDREQRLRTFKSYMHPTCDRRGDDYLLADRSGVYHSIDILPPALTMNDGGLAQEREKAVRVSLLDTRMHRELYAVPGIGSIGYYFPIIGRLFPVLGGFLRFVSGHVGAANSRENAILGAQQWAWLEESICGKSSRDIALHIVVSSIQVTTRNPLVESWSHFPAELERLLRLLKSCSTAKEFILISGDVHFSEIMMSADAKKPLEITSSGLTHNCASGIVPAFLCKWLVESASVKRAIAPETRTEPPTERYRTDHAFGTLSVPLRQLVASSSAKEGDDADRYVLRFVRTDDGNVALEREYDSMATSDAISPSLSAASAITSRSKGGAGSGSIDSRRALIEPYSAIELDSTWQWVNTTIAAVVALAIAFAAFSMLHSCCLRRNRSGRTKRGLQEKGRNGTPCMRQASSTPSKPKNS